jgi:sec-independent protein translocase protein TatB
MFDAGLPEMILIMVIALLVVGPKRLPGLARQAGYWLGKARGYLAGVRNDIAQELHADELRGMMQRQEEEMKELRGLLNKTKAEVTGGLEIEQEHLLKAIDEQPKPASPGLESATGDQQDSPSGNERKD